MERDKGYVRLIEEILLINRGEQEDLLDDRIKWLKKLSEELNHAEYSVIRQIGHRYDFDWVAKVLEVSPGYVRRILKRGLRHLRAPKRYYRLKFGLDYYNKEGAEPKGVSNIEMCGFSTRTTNVLKRNGLRTVEEFESFIGNVPERAAYIEGLGKFGMSEIIYYYIH